MDETRARRLEALAHRALPAWDLEPIGITLIATGENTVYRVDCRDGTRYALRIHRPGYHTLAELESELDWTTALNEAGIGAPNAVRTRDGSGYATVSFADSQETRHVGLVEWIDGVALAEHIDDETDAAAVASRFHALGALAARIHNQASTWRLPHRFVRHALDADGLMGDAPFWGPFWDLPQLARDQRALALAARDALHQALVRYGKDSRHYGLIHADLHPYNVMVDGTRTTVIDFDDSGFGWHGYEIAVALYSYQRDPRFVAMRDALIAGYRSQRDLDDDVVARLPMFFLIRGWAILGWIHGRPELDRGAALPRLIEEVCTQSEAFLRPR